MVRVLAKKEEKIMQKTYFAYSYSHCLFCLFLFVCLGGRQGEADKLNCNPLQRVGIPFFRDLASRPRTLLLLFNPQ